MDPNNSDHRLEFDVPPVAPPTKPSGLTGWFYSHPYSAGLGGIGLLVVAGTFFVITKASLAPAAPDTMAGGAGTISNAPYAPNGAVQQQSNVGIMQQVQTGAPYTYTVPTPQQNVDTGDAVDAGFDFNAFVSMLSAPSTSGSPQKTTPAAGSAYTFLPGGLVSVEAPKTRTVLQKHLYDYGNDVGSFIQSFEQENPNESRILTDQAQDRADAGKAAALQSLAQGLSALGDNLLTIDEVPSQMTAAHTALANSYKNIGEKLALVPDAQSTADFVAAVKTYDATADVFVKNYVAFANLFVAYGVTFSSGDPGSVFTFTPASL